LQAWESSDTQQNEVLQPMPRGKLLLPQMSSSSLAKA
jgi:hypothetical protein